MNNNITLLNLNRSLYDPSIPIWDHAIYAKTAAYALHYVIDDQVPVKNHLAQIAEIVEAANLVSVVYPKIYVYTYKNIEPSITYEYLLKELRKYFQMPPSILPIAIISLSEDDPIPEIKRVVSNTIKRQIKRLAHPPVMPNMYQIPLYGIREPILAIIAMPLDKASNQLIRIHMVYAFGVINAKTEFDWLNKGLYYDPMEISGV